MRRAECPHCASPDAQLSHHEIYCPDCQLHVTVDEVPWLFGASINSSLGEDVEPEEEGEFMNQEINETRDPAPYDIVAYPNEETGKSWERVGYAYPAKNGKSLRLKIFNDRELPQDGKFLLVESIKAPQRPPAEAVPF